MLPNGAMPAQARVLLLGTFGSSAHQSQGSQVSPDNNDEISSHQHLWEIFIIDSALFSVLIGWRGKSIKKVWLLTLNTIATKSNHRYMEK